MRSKIKLFVILFIFMSSRVQANQEIWNLKFDETNIPYVSLNIAGEETNLTLDTGSNIALHLPLTLINKLPNIVELKKERSTDITGKINFTRNFKVNDLIINSLKFNNINVVEYKPWGWCSDGNCHNQSTPTSVIGLNFFKNHVLTLDLHHKRIIVSDEHNESLDFIKDWQPIPFLLSDEGIIIEMTDNIKKYKLALDTGATVSMIKAESLSEKTIKSTNEQFDGYKTVKLSSNLKQISSNNINALIIDDLPKEFEQDGLIGCDFLDENLIKIDLKNKKLWVKKIDISNNK